MTPVDLEIEPEFNTGTNNVEAQTKGRRRGGKATAENGRERSGFQSQTDELLDILNAS